MGLKAQEMAPTLSHQIIGVREAWIRRSSNMYKIQDNSTAECAKDLYSDSVLDFVIVGCFFTLQDFKEKHTIEREILVFFFGIRPQPRKQRQPNVCKNQQSGVRLNKHSEGDLCLRNFVGKRLMRKTAVLNASTQYWRGM